MTLLANWWIQRVSLVRTDLETPHNYKYWGYYLSRCQTQLETNPSDRDIPDCYVCYLFLLINGIHLQLVGNRFASIFARHLSPKSPLLAQTVISRQPKPNPATYLYFER